MDGIDRFCRLAVHPSIGSGDQNRLLMAAGQRAVKAVGYPADIAERPPLYGA
ncbi:MAG: hypothetical protein RBR16_05255 [Syntrophus sp. (in: bacteria)]|nr:hypothetical protein [Syntrophus sp. (in: bacteria)]